MVTRLLPSLALGLALATAAGAQEVRVDLELTPAGTVELDELVVLSIRIDGPRDRRVRPEADFELDNLRVVSGPSTRSRLLFQDGGASRSLTLSWSLKPLAVGPARVKSVRVSFEGREAPLPDRRLEVREPSPPAFNPRQVTPGGTPDNASAAPFEGRAFGPPRRRRSRPVAPPEIYLEAVVQPKDPYVGEQVLYTLYLYTQADVRAVHPEELPDFKGFWSRVVPQPDQLRPEMVVRGGERIGKVVLLQRALFPRRAGRAEIGPVQARLAALVPDEGELGSLLPRTRDIVRTAGAVSVDVRRLPPPPAGFQGAVGQVEITAELTPPEVASGDAATLSVKLAGRGHFQGLPPPLLSEIPGVEVFPPQQRSSETVESRSVAGERAWSFVLVPERPGSWQLPPIEIPYFDPAEERYRIARATPPALLVRGSRSLAQRDGQVVELHPIRTAALPAPGAGGVFDPRPWLFGLPWVLAAMVLAARRRGRKLRGFPRLGAGSFGFGGGPRRRRLLDRLNAAAGERQPRQAAAEIEEAWRQFLHDRWQLPPGSPSPRWGTLLAARGARRQAADELVKLADDLHYLRYAPKLSSTDELQRELVERSRKLARALA